MRKPFVIAIDGPAASGKGTLAEKLAVHYALPHLDTGLTYRAVAYHMLTNGVDFANENAAISIAEKLDVEKLDQVCLGTHFVSEAASRIAILPRLRHALSVIQRQMAEKLPGAVLDGRDIGTVVCPSADVKFYVIADVKNRARRRYLQVIAMGSNAVYNDILMDIKRRDERDMNRIEGPLRQVEDAFLLDTTELSITETFRVACRLINNKREASRQCQ